MFEVFRLGLTSLLLALPLGPALASGPPQGKQVVVAAGSEQKGWLGVTITDVTAKTAKEASLPDAEGALVTSVVEGSPAEKAGIRKDDIVLEFGTRAIYDAGDLVKAVGRTEPETKTNVVVWREKKKQSLAVVVGKAPRPERKRIRSLSVGPLNLGYAFSSTVLGMTLRTLNPQLAEYFGAPDKEGVLVEEVEKESAAAKGGLNAGDVIVRFGSKRTDEVQDVRRALSAYDAGESVPVEIIRKGAPKTVTITVEEETFEFEHQIGIPPVPRPRIDVFRHRDPADAFLWFDRDDLRDLRHDIRAEAESLMNDLRENVKEIRKHIVIEL